MDRRGHAESAAVGAAALGAGALAAYVTLAQQPPTRSRWRWAGRSSAPDSPCAGQPGNRVGALSIATGFAWFLTNWAHEDRPLPFALSLTLGALFVALLVHLVVAFPRGRVDG